MATEQVDLTVVDGGCGVGSGIWSTNFGLLVGLVLRISDLNPRGVLDIVEPSVVKSGLGVVVTTEDEDLTLGLFVEESNVLTSGEGLVIAVDLWAVPFALVLSQRVSI